MAFLGFFWAILGFFWAILGFFLAILYYFLAILDFFEHLGYCGLLLGYFGLFKAFQASLELFGYFGLLLSYSGLFRASFGFFELLLGYFGLFRASFRLLWGSFGLLLGYFWASSSHDINIFGNVRKHLGKQTLRANVHLFYIIYITMIPIPTEVKFHYQSDGAPFFLHLLLSPLGYFAYRILHHYESSIRESSATFISLNRGR